jgi:hypothetical protein
MSGGGDYDVYVRTRDRILPFSNSGGAPALRGERFCTVRHEVAAGNYLALSHAASPFLPDQTTANDGHAHI